MDEESRLAPGGTLPIRISLTTDVFEQARERYLDEFKPDPLTKRQIQTVSLQWSDMTTNSTSAAAAAGENNNTPSNDDDKSASSKRSKQSVIEGSLEIGGDYLVATIRAICQWTTNLDDSTGKSGSLHFTLSTRCRFWTKSELKRRQSDEGVMASNNDDESKESKKKDKVKEKLRSKMLPRLREDAYIAKLLTGADDGEPSCPTQAGKGEAYRVLAEATIRQDHHQQDQQHHVDKLEERVDVADDVVEGLRRAVFPSIESTLDLVELLLFFPYLPRTNYAFNATTTPLADRASLRLLEDAMFDACEREGEDELIEDLSLSNEANDVNAGGHDGKDGRGVRKDDELNRNTRRKKAKR